MKLASSTLPESGASYQNRSKYPRTIQACPLLVVQWIERMPPKRQIQVRFLSRGPSDRITPHHNTSKTRMFHSIAGFLLPHSTSPRNMTYQQNVGTFNGTCTYQQSRYQQTGQLWHLQTHSQKTSNPPDRPLATNTRTGKGCIYTSKRRANTGE